MMTTNSSAVMSWGLLCVFSQAYLWIYFTIKIVCRQVVNIEYYTIYFPLHYIFLMHKLSNLESTKINIHTTTTFFISLIWLLDLPLAVDQCVLWLGPTLVNSIFQILLSELLSPAFCLNFTLKLKCTLYSSSRGLFLVTGFQLS